MEILTFIIKFFIAVLPKFNEFTPWVIFFALLFIPIITFANKPRKISQEDFDPTEIGEEGENLVAKKLDDLKKDGDVVFNNCLFGTKFKSTQVDHIFVNSAGVFIIETKNYGGVISGEDGQDKWVQEFGEDRKYEFYNPVKQNAGHIKYLRKILGEGVTFHSVVVFVKNNLSPVYNNSAIGLDELEHVIKSKHPVYSERRKRLLIKKIQLALNESTATIEDHVRFVNSKSEEKRQPCRSSTEETSEFSRFTALMLAIFFGWCGLHQLYVRRTSLFVSYFLTDGLFGVGWLTDIGVILTGGFVDGFYRPVTEWFPNKRRKK